MLSSEDYKTWPFLLQRVEIKNHNNVRTLSFWFSITYVDVDEGVWLWLENIGSIIPIDNRGNKKLIQIIIRKLE